MLTGFEAAFKFSDIMGGSVLDTYGCILASRGRVTSSGLNFFYEVTDKILSTWLFIIRIYIKMNFVRTQVQKDDEW